MAGGPTHSLTGAPGQPVPGGWHLCGQPGRQGASVGGVQGDRALSGGIPRSQGRGCGEHSQGGWGTASQLAAGHRDRSLPGRGAASMQAGTAWRSCGDAMNPRVREGGERPSQAPVSQVCGSRGHGPTTPHPTGESRRAQLGPGRGSGERQASPRRRHHHQQCPQPGPRPPEPSPLRGRSHGGWGRVGLFADVRGQVHPLMWPRRLTRHSL